MTILLQALLLIHLSHAASIEQKNKDLQNEEQSTEPVQAALDTDMKQFFLCRKPL